MKMLSLVVWLFVAYLSNISLGEPAPPSSPTGNSDSEIAKNKCQKVGGTWTCSSSDPLSNACCQTSDAGIFCLCEGLGHGNGRCHGTLCFGNRVGANCIFHWDCWH